MTDILTTHFVDGSDVEIHIVLDEARIMVTAFDEKSRERYNLTFVHCITFKMNYSSTEPDLNDLTDGIWELERIDPKTRVFQIHFVDESILEIHCTDFSITPIEKGDGSDSM